MYTIILKGLNADVVISYEDGMRYNGRVNHKTLTLEGEG
jgi:hypothetical protein